MPLVCPSQYSMMWHSLVSGFGSHWRERDLIMFTVYVDDSGTSRGQPVAVAGVLIIPALQIIPLDKEWATFSAKYGFTDLHAAECAALNPKTYPTWDEAKVEKVFWRARQIIKKRASKAFSFSIYKKDFDDAAPLESRKTGGQNHYTWALRNLMSLLVQWHGERRIPVPFEFVFDRAAGRDKREIEMLMAQFDSLAPGKFEGHYQFRNRADVPALQCVDLLAWSCYSKSRLRYGPVPIPRVAEESFDDFLRHRDGQWLTAMTFDPRGLKEAFEMDRATIDEQARQEWYRNYKAKRETPKRRNK
ncbi:MAG: DUF3800 domain-containing protein [Terracidiphilus sp.]